MKRTGGVYVNHVVLIGNLGRDPEQHELSEDGKKVTILSLGQNRPGARRPMFHRVAVYGKSGEAAFTHLHKGDQVCVEGELISRMWKGRDGSTKQTVEVQAKPGGVSFLRRRAGPGESGKTHARNEVPAGSDGAPPDDFYDDYDPEDPDNEGQPF